MSSTKLVFCGEYHAETDHKETKVLTAALAHSTNRRQKPAAPDLTVLQDLPHAALTELWQDMFRTSPPRNLSRRLMLHALAYQIQVQAHGGLSRALQ